MANKVPCGGFNVGGGLTIDESTRTLSVNADEIGGVQSDWNENNPNSPAYIKNRFGGYMDFTPSEYIDAWLGELKNGTYREDEIQGLKNLMREGGGVFGLNVVSISYNDTFLECGTLSCDMGGNLGSITSDSLSIILKDESFTIACKKEGDYKIQAGRNSMQRIPSEYISDLPYLSLKGGTVTGSTTFGTVGSTNTKISGYGMTFVTDDYQCKLSARSGALADDFFFIQCNNENEKVVFSFKNSGGLRVVTVGGIEYDVSISADGELLIKKV